MSTLFKVEYETSCDLLDNNRVGQRGGGEVSRLLLSMEKYGVYYDHSIRLELFMRFSYSVCVATGPSSFNVYRMQHRNCR